MYGQRLKLQHAMEDKGEFQSQFCHAAEYHVGQNYYIIYFKNHVIQMFCNRKLIPTGRVASVDWRANPLFCKAQHWSESSRTAHLGSHGAKKETQFKGVGHRVHYHQVLKNTSPYSTTGAATKVSLSSCKLSGSRPSGLAWQSKRRNPCGVTSVSSLRCKHASLLSTKSVTVWVLAQWLSDTITAGLATCSRHGNARDVLPLKINCPRSTLFSGLQTRVTVACCLLQAPRAIGRAAVPFHVQCESAIGTKKTTVSCRFRDQDTLQRSLVLQKLRCVSV